MNATYKNTTKHGEQSSVDHLADKVREGGRALRDVAEGAAETVKQTVADAGDTAREMGATAKDVIGEAVAETKPRLDGVIRKAQDTAQHAKDAIVSGAGSTLATVRDAAVEKADAARESLSDVGDRLAATLQNASADTEDDALKARVLSSVAQGLTNASDSLRQRSVAEIGADVRDLARRHPGAFVAAAALAGFMAARFIRSSSHRDRGI